MSEKPILIFQMQRMGDLVLSFPFLGWLSRQYPKHPLWVMGEKTFFEQLMPLSPQVTYFSYDGTKDFRGQVFSRVINLSHRPEAAAIAGSVSSEEIIGPYMTPDGLLYINGNWQLYRASLTHNNHYNRYHWADLHALDCINPALLRATVWPTPRSSGKNAGEGGRIGLFIGASQPDKHPEVPFWAALARQLIRLGHKPVLLGGKDEAVFGRAIARELKAYPLNLCGRFQIRELAEFIAQLDLLVVPDTGPMHIAAWTGTPVLNLSLGPVNPWETGPFSPGHHVLQADIPCAGCWECIQERVLCKESMSAGRVVAAVEGILARKDLASPLFAKLLRGTRLFRTSRTSAGLYQLNVLHPSTEAESATYVPGASVPLDAETYTERNLFAKFWQAWFGGQFGLFSAEHPQTVWSSELAPVIPRTCGIFLREVELLALAVAKAKRNKMDVSAFLSGDWDTCSPLLRPFTGFMQMKLQNAGNSREAQLDFFTSLDSLYSLAKKI